MEIKREHQINFLYIIVAFPAVIVIQGLLYQPSHIKTIPYSEFQKLIDQDKVTDLVIGPDQITGSYKKPEGQPNTAAGQAGTAGGRASAPPVQPQHFVTQRVPQDLAKTLAEKGLTFSGQPGPGLLQTVLGWLLPTVGFVVLWMFLVRPMAGEGMGGMMSIGKNKDKVFVEKDIKTSFTDAEKLSRATAPEKQANIGVGLAAARPMG